MLGYSSLKREITGQVYQHKKSLFLWVLKMRNVWGSCGRYRLSVERPNTRVTGLIYPAMGEGEEDVHLMHIICRHQPD